MAKRGRHTWKQMRSKSWDTTYLVLIIVLAAILRFHQYTVVPPDFETKDEIAFAWAGWTLINEGEPKSWSWLPAYNPLHFPVVTWREAKFRVVHPWFDHPPLFSLMVGVAATLTGAQTMFELTEIWPLRIVPILLSIVAVWIIYLLANELYGKHVGLISALMYATIPTIIGGNRLVVSENLLVPLFLGGILLLVKYFKTQQLWYRNAAAVIAGLATLAKVPGIFVLVTLGIFLLFKKRWRDFLIVNAIGLGIFSLYFLYGWLYDWNLFTAVLSSHEVQTSSLWTAWKLIFHPRLAMGIFYDGWVFLGWLSLIYAAIKKRWFVLIPVGIYMLGLSVMVWDARIYGWYFIPLYPFLAIALGLYLKEFVAKPNLLRALPVLLAGMWGVYVLFARPSLLILLGVLIALLAPFCATHIKTIPFRQKYVWFILIMVVALNCSIVLLFPKTYPSVLTLSSHISDVIKSVW